ncbi:MAG: tRNA (adenosine(37)-N6)-threonylcarbamoyltransferase complex ATPase subunit type 1 TsaE [Rhodospirillaceae bacterium]|nr:tRNA (adenosine(37)-N6)-threonylcarbamoyltransferase complex ATPase subunit type 1 TsaE [Rhodospirillaceae bacterium]MDD9914436.1 tRNA (adenosine(37)-N6)-threonylcarbamoyltransferase complex ATPase subunit type 1 TsaE [Rhodospirillaceae bacterium]MDD9926234.1 tRNA (adenosine(37)-N6)-threonylcarbamoyltransferase complex ATPase subunit type 1 TsaE [Rhodospirillaceae bacterium]
MSIRNMLLPDLAATESFARRLAPLLRPGDIIALGGDLGAGKTAFSRALICALNGADTEVPSPTFTLVQIYELPEFDLWHFDLYRLEAAQDALELDIEDAFATGVSLIEWPERLGPYLPANRLDIRFSFADTPTARCLQIQGGNDWVCRLESLNDG